MFTGIFDSCVDMAKAFRFYHIKHELKTPCTWVKELTPAGMRAIPAQSKKAELSSAFCLEPKTPFYSFPNPTREARYEPFYPANMGAGTCSIPRRGSLPGCGAEPRSTKSFLYHKKRKQENTRFLPQAATDPCLGYSNEEKKSMCGKIIFSAICPAGSRTPDHPGRIALPLSYRTFSIIYGRIKL